MLVHQVFIVALLVVSQVVAKLPEFINQCGLSDPKFSECMLKNANIALPHLLKGVPDLTIPSLLSFKPGPLDFQANENLHFHSDNGNTENSGHSLTETSYNPDTNIIKFVIRIGHSEWTVDFINNGTVLDKPILEKGNAIILMEDVDISYEGKMESKTIDNVKYYQIASPFKTETTIDKFDFKFVDQESVNEAMTTEQRKVYETSFSDMKSPMADKISQLAGPLLTHILNTIFKLVPEDELFSA